MIEVSFDISPEKGCTIRVNREDPKIVSPEAQLRIARCVDIEADLGGHVERYVLDSQNNLHAQLARRLPDSIKESARIAELLASLSRAPGGH